MGYELRVQPGPPELADLGAVVEIREINALRQFEIVSEHKGDLKTLKRLYLAESLYVDGAPIGVAGLEALPSRFVIPLIKAMRIVEEVHAEPAAVAEAGDDAPKD